jgi:hypothetical protein
MCSLSLYLHDVPQESARALHSHGVMQALRRLINRSSASGSAEEQEVLSCTLA